MSQTYKGLFVYPWTLQAEGAASAISYYKESLLTDDLYVATSYHSGRLFHPRLKQKINMRHYSGLSFLPEMALYPEQLKPQIDQGVNDSKLHHKIRQACEQNDISYNAWMVGLHNSSLGRKHPQCCVHNVFGDVYDYILCPNRPVVQQYLKALVLDTCQQLQPHALLLETPGYLGFVHGHHHELVLANLGHVGEYLLSLCFCSACKQTAEANGINVEGLEVRVKDRLNYLIEHERRAVDEHFTQAELASIFLEDEDLYRYTVMRTESVTHLISEIKTITERFGSKLYVVPSAFVNPSSRAWMEGTSLTQLSSVVDGFVLLSYFSNPQLVKADVEWMRLWVKDTPLSVGFNVGAPSTTGLEGLKQCVDAALTSNPASIIYYNVSLLTNTRMKWIGEVNETLMDK